MDCEPSGPFITSVPELKLDSRTMFEWQRHSSTSTTIPHYDDLLSFVNLRAQAAEHSVSIINKPVTPAEERRNHRTLSSHTTNIKLLDTGVCVACKATTPHQLYSCTKFRSMSHEDRMGKDNKLCQNCLRSGHFVRQCKSLHKCHECQRPHHSLLHQVSKDTSPHRKEDPTPKKNGSTTTTGSISVMSHAASVIKPNALLMTCQVRSCHSQKWSLSQSPCTA